MKLCLRLIALFCAGISAVVAYDVAWALLEEGAVRTGPVMGAAAAAFVFAAVAVTLWRFQPVVTPPHPGFASAPARPEARPELYLVSSRSES